MSVISSPALFMGEDGYQISRSVRLRSSASAYFNRTLTTPTSRQKITLSFWAKVGSNSTYGDVRGYLFDASTSGSTIGAIYFNGGLSVWEYNAGTLFQIYESAVRRDPSAWYHFVVVIDTTLATSADRVQIWCNGVRSAVGGTQPSQNYNLTYLNTASVHNIGKTQYRTSANEQYDGLLAEMYFIDGQALTPSSFGENDSIIGVWKPKKYAGTYGTNGFYLNFSDNSAATAAAIGKDSSGNGNNWTPNNISVTTGSTYDSMLDTPTPYADGGNGRGNYATLNPLAKFVTGTFNYSNGNLDVSDAASSYGAAVGTLAVSSGKWYWEVTCVSSGGSYGDIGIFPSTATDAATFAYPGASTSYAYQTDGQKVTANTGSAYGATYTTGDVIGVALNLDAGTLVFYKNGVSQGTAFSSLSGSFIPAVGDGQGSTLYSWSCNFGQRPFAYTPPSGYKALNTQNLPDSTIKAGNKYFDVAIQTGNTTGRTVSGLAFQPDLVWVKNRAGSTNRRWGVIDSVRGVNKTLTTQYTDAEVTSQTDLLTAFNSDGFTIGADAGLYGWNGFAESYAHFVWKKGATPGFDIVTYTGNGAGTRSVAHSLGVAPKFIVIKDRSSGTAYWPVYHASIPTQYLTLNSTSAGTAGQWISADSSNFSFSSLSSWTNTNADNYVAYLWAEVAGFSKFGSYTGNGSADGPFVYCGFRPKFILRKWVDGANQWVIFDTSRDTYNQSIKSLYPNLSNAEETLYNFCDILSNGFKMRNTDNSVNGAGGTYIYAAFAENPFKYALAR